MGNYFQDNTETVAELKHFPFSTFQDYKESLGKGEIVDIGVPMDHARKWAMESSYAPKLQAIIKLVLTVCIYLLPIFYIVMAFVLHNYWLAPFALLPLIIFATGSPMARKMVPLHWILLGVLILWWLTSGVIPHFIYWLPLVLEYKVLDYLYKDSAKLVRQIAQKDEITLVLFWKWWDLGLVFKNGEEWSQRSKKTLNNFEYYDDIQVEWESYLEQKNQ